MSARRLVVVVGSFAAFLLAASPASSQGNSSAARADYPVQITQPGGFPPPEHPDHPKEIPLHRPHFRPGAGNVADPVLQTSAPTPAAAQTGGQWEGLGAAYPGFTITAVPPDTNFAVGPNHIVQWVNNGLVIFDKKGNQLQAPIVDSTFWGASSTTSTCYQGGGFSDPIVEYDKAADRWVVGEVALPINFLGTLIGQFAQCFAVSKTSDPTFTSDANGNNTSYNIWAYGFGANVNDYDKISVWSDAYDVTWNIFQNGTTFIGAEVCAWSRSDMLNGVAAPAFKCFQLSSNFASVLGANLDGATGPPAGSPDFFMDIDPILGTLNLWKLQVDQANFANSTLTGPTSITGVAAFTAPCYNSQTQQFSQDCIPQNGTTQLVDAIGDRLMYRLAYRNFGTHESLVANHTVLTAGGNTGVRWYEVRDPNGTPTIFQQGTFAPDSDNRWMASIAMDQTGNIGLGYNVASASTFDSIRFTGREAGDLIGTLQAETSLVAGGGSQTGSNRWGDYSAMQVDPSDDCTFWYTQEYYQSVQATNWDTRIGSFKFASCPKLLLATTTTLGPSSANPSTYGQSVTFTATVSGSGTPGGTVTFKDGSTTLGSSALNGSGVAMFSIATLAAGPHSITAVYGGDSTFSGSTSSALNQTVSKANSNTSVGASPIPSTYQQSVKLTATVSPVAPASTTPTGTVTFFDGGTSLGSAALSGGAASISTSSLSVGPHSFTASYGGDADYNNSASSPLPDTVNKGASTASVVGSPNPSNFGTSVKFTATVSPVSPATTTPSGTVTFLDSGVSIGSAPLSGGTASFSTSSLAAGIHSITASYSGDGNYTTSTSQPYAQTVNSSASPDFSVTASPGSASITRGATAKYTVSVAALNGFAGNVTLSLTGAPSRSTTSFTPNPVATSGNSTLAVRTTSKTPRGTYTLTIKGTSGGLTHTTSVQLTVN